MNNGIAVGSQWVAGNTFRPDHDRVVSLVSWSDLPESAKRVERLICYWVPEESRASLTFVGYTQRGRKGTRFSELSVFEATRYPTLEAMVTAYAR